MDHRFRDTHRYGRAHGFASGYSTLEEGWVENTYLEYQAVLIPFNHCYHSSVPAEELGNPPFGNIEYMFRAAHRYAQQHGYPTGFPAFEQGRDETGKVIFGTTLLHDSVVEIRSVPAEDLGSPNFGDVKRMVIAAHRYARSVGDGAFVSGFPLFEQGIEAGRLHYGTALIKQTASFQHVPADVLALFGASTEITAQLINEMQGVLIFNNSGRTVLVKDEHTSEVRKVEAKRWAVGRFDGMATKNRSKGKIAKCGDWNIGYVTHDGGVRCFGLKRQSPYIGIEPEWHNDWRSLGDDWRELDDAAKAFDPRPSGNSGGERPERESRHRDVPRGGIIHDAPAAGRELASRTA